MKIIQFSPPDITETEINEVIEELKHGWITTGFKTKKLEKMIAERCGTNKVVCLNSSTAYAEITLRILGTGKGDKVIVPTYTYTASAGIIKHIGAKIVLVGCEKEKFTMDYEKLENAITTKTKVIIPVDLFGVPCDYETIFGIINKKRSLFCVSDNPIQKELGRIIVMADGAHSFGVQYKGIPIGSVADFTNFSLVGEMNVTDKICSKVA